MGRGKLQPPLSEPGVDRPILRGGAFHGRAEDDRVVANAGGAVRVLKAVAAIDAGQIINPDGVISQTKGRAYPGDQLGAEGTDDVR
jgi:hypothetical protein